MRSLSDIIAHKFHSSESQRYIFYNNPQSFYSPVKIPTATPTQKHSLPNALYPKNATASKTFKTTFKLKEKKFLKAKKIQLLSSRIVESYSYSLAQLFLSVLLLFIFLVHFSLSFLLFFLCSF